MLCMQTSVGFRIKKESEEQQMYKIIQLLQPARIMIHRMDRHWFFFVFFFHIGQLGRYEGKRPRLLLPTAG